MGLTSTLLFRTVITILATGLLVGGGTYYAVSNKATSDQQILQEKIDSLSRKVSNLEEEALKAAATPTTNSATPAPNPPTPAVDPTADWKTYTNTKYGYSIKYEPTYYVYGADGSKNNLATTTTANFAKTGATDRDYYITVSGENYSLVFGNDLKADTVKTFGTFQFSGQSATGSTTDWQTYTNTKHGYEVKYQKGWYVYNENGATTGTGTANEANFAETGAGDRSYYIKVSNSNYSVIFGKDTNYNIGQILGTFLFKK